MSGSYVMCIRKICRNIASSALIVLVTLLMLELVLQCAAFVLGGRQTAENSPLSDKAKRVVFLGDSHTYGLYLSEQESFPAQLEQLWNAAGSAPQMEAVNLGYPGTNSSRILKSLPAVIDKLKPDVIVVLVGINDFWTAPVSVNDEQDASAHIIDWLFRHSRVFKLCYMLQKQSYNKNLLQVDQSRRQLKYSVEGNAEFLKAVKEGGSLSQFDNDSAVQYDGNEFAIGAIFDPQVSQNSKPMPALKKNLLAIADIAASKQVKILFLTYLNDNPLFVSVNNQYRLLQQKHKAAVLDMSAFYREQCQPAQSCDAYFFPDMHPNAAGYHEMALKILPVLKQVLATEPLNTAVN